MATRSGSVDPGALLYAAARARALASTSSTTRSNIESGLLGARRLGRHARARGRDGAARARRLRRTASRRRSPRWRPRSAGSTRSSSRPASARARRSSARGRLRAARLPRRRARPRARTTRPSRTARSAPPARRSACTSSRAREELVAARAARRLLAGVAVRTGGPLSCERGISRGRRGRRWRTKDRPWARRMPAEPLAPSLAARARGRSRGATSAAASSPCTPRSGSSSSARSSPFVVFALRPTISPTAAWSSWRPTGRRRDREGRQGDRRPRRARVPPRKKGSQLVAVVPSPPAVTAGTQNVAINAVAVHSAATGNTDVTQLEPGKTEMYSFCGLGTHCSIATGQPSQTRGQLVRREALETALYTFKYMLGDRLRDRLHAAAQEHPEPDDGALLPAAEPRRPARPAALDHAPAPQAAAARSR